MNKSSGQARLTEVFGLAPVIPVITIADAAHALPLARALVSGGLRAIEITLRTDAAFEAARAIIAEVPDAIERLLRRYLDERLPNENLRRFFARHSDEELRECLAGEFLAAVARDPSPGKVPHAVEG